VECLPTRLDGPILVEPAVHGDHRGCFVETYRRDPYAEAVELDDAANGQLLPFVFER